MTRIHDRAIAEAGASASPEEVDRRVRELEVDLAIDRRIGVDFPREKRDQLLRVRERVEAKRKELTLRLLRREISRARFVASMQDVVRSSVAELSSDLTREELEAFLGTREPGAGGLPLDPGRIDPEMGEP